MVIRINLRNIYYEVCMISPLAFTLCYAFGGDSLCNRFILLLLFVGYIYLMRDDSEKNQGFEIIITNSLMIIYILYTFMNSGLYGVTHSYFYDYIFLIIMILNFRKKENRHEFFDYLIVNKNRYLVYLLCFLGIILSSIVTKAGIGMSSGSLVLRGPFITPHYLSYICIGAYCSIGVLSEDFPRWLVMVIRVLLVAIIIMTGVRSTALGMAILIVFEYCSLRKFKNKALVLAVAVLAFLYFALGTDILVDNPIIQKSIYAVQHNGSLTNNREWFREVALNYYRNHATIIQHLFGVGMINEVEAIYSSVGVHIHAHNDYVNALVGYGIIGFLIMVGGQVSILNFNRNRLATFFMNLFVFILTFYNGFALYTMLVATLPSLVLFFEIKGSDKKNTGELK